jgi:Spy/CpxP family protein refolding chaperone
MKVRHYYRWLIRIMVMSLVFIAFSGHCSFGNDDPTGATGNHHQALAQGEPERSPEPNPGQGRWQRHWQGLPGKSPTEGTDQPSGRPGAGGQWDLKLTPQQSEQLKTIRSRYEDRQQDLLFNAREKKMELMKCLREAQPDKSKINKKLDEIVKLEGSRQRLIVDEFFEVRQILTPDQVKIFTRKAMRAMMKN